MPNPPSPETTEQARALYARGVPVRTIMADTGLSRRQIYYWLDRGPGRDAEATPKPTPRRATRRRSDLARPPSLEARRRLMGRLWRAAECQISEIEDRLVAATAGEADAPPRDAERDARALAVLARVMRELSALDAAARRDRAADEAGRASRDPETFRRELARRLAQIQSGEKGAAAQAEGEGE
ncbi:hypothetical protein GCM10007301_10650 [Azorhizobium oxalatiphilum]|uniref:Helix-turn-helix domain-containing protein n=1 Tax=Azorhizobium oxalatiphilum TaxID=980631 RepID=A0A917BPN9_9HYPH|nr:hypothetical protein [Azorhizobium oxalatiphilum]GGF53034.1 hypothetical protein GCM10007301_10650 [Azorhizobium oxalatiphilum]